MFVKGDVTYLIFNSQSSFINFLIYFLFNGTIGFFLLFLYIFLQPSFIISI